MKSLKDLVYGFLKKENTETLPEVKSPEEQLLEYLAQSGIPPEGHLLLRGATDEDTGTLYLLTIDESYMDSIVSDPRSYSPEGAAQNAKLYVGQKEDLKEFEILSGFARRRDGGIWSGGSIPIIYSDSNSNKGRLHYDTIYNRKASNNICGEDADLNLWYWETFR